MIMSSSYFLIHSSDWRVSAYEQNLHTTLFNSTQADPRKLHFLSFTGEKLPATAFKSQTYH